MGSVLVGAVKKGMAWGEVHRLFGQPNMSCYGQEVDEWYDSYGINVTYAPCFEEFRPKVASVRYRLLR